MLHLVTQRDQPYGSVRRCCERCGVACGPYFPSSRLWTDDEEEFNQSQQNCSVMNSRAEQSRQEVS